MAQRPVVERLHNGSRPQEIAQSRANVESAKADAANARQQYERAKNLSRRSSGAGRQPAGRRQRQGHHRHGRREARSLNRRRST